MIHVWNFNEMAADAKDAWEKAIGPLVSESDDKPEWVEHKYAKNDRVLDITLRRDKAGTKKGKLRGRIACNPRTPGTRNHEISEKPEGTWFGAVFFIPEGFRLPYGNINGLMNFHTAAPTGGENDNDVTPQPLETKISSKKGGVWINRAVCGDKSVVHDSRKWKQDIGRHVPILYWMRASKDNSGGARIWFPDSSGKPQLVVEYDGRTIPEGFGKNVTKLENYCNWSEIEGEDEGKSDGPKELPLYLCAMTLATDVSLTDENIDKIWEALTTGRVEE